MTPASIIFHNCILTRWLTVTSTVFWWTHDCLPSGVARAVIQDTGEDSSWETSSAAAVDAGVVAVLGSGRGDVTRLAKSGRQGGTCWLIENHLLIGSYLVGINRAHKVHLSLWTWAHISLNIWTWSAFSIARHFPRNTLPSRAWAFDITKLVSWAPWPEFAAHNGFAKVSASLLTLHNYTISVWFDVVSIIVDILLYNASWKHCW